jgi:hypothetical protein
MTVPIIIESRVRGSEVRAEIKRVLDALPQEISTPIADWPSLSSRAITA